VGGIGPRKPAGEAEASDTEAVREAGVWAAHSAHLVGGAVKPPVAYCGGKTTIADRIVALLPEHGHYVEPFAGSLAVLLAKPPSRMETVNDIDQDLIFWRVLRDRPGDLERTCGLTPHSRAEHQLAYQAADDELEHARESRCA
jgi:site-specific DNA-adenine methylase